MSPEWSAFVQPAATLLGSILTASATGWIAFRVYRLQVQQKAAAWAEQFREIHVDFWNNEDYATVRTWIICDEEYTKIAPILRMRVNGQSPTATEAVAIEKIDRFCAIMLRVKQVNAAAPKLDDLTPELKKLIEWEKKSYYKWWFGSMLEDAKTQKPKDERREFWQYIKTFWDQLTTPCQRWPETVLQWLS